MREIFLCDICLMFLVNVMFAVCRLIGVFSFRKAVSVFYLNSIPFNFNVSVLLVKFESDVYG